MIDFRFDLACLGKRFVLKADPESSSRYHEEIVRLFAQIKQLASHSKPGVTFKGFTGKRKTVEESIIFTFVVIRVLCTGQLRL